MKQSVLIILFLPVLLVVNVTFALPTLTDSLEETTTILQFEFIPDTTPSLGRQEEVGSTGPPVLPQIDEDSDEDEEEEEVTEKGSTLSPIFIRKTLATSDFGHTRPVAGIGGSQEKISTQKIYDGINEGQVQMVHINTTASPTYDSFGTDWATHNLTALDSPEEAKTFIQHAPTLPLTIESSVEFQKALPTKSEHESESKAKPVSNGENVENSFQPTAESSGLSAAENDEEGRRDAILETSQGSFSNTANLVDNANSSDFERDWALATGDEILSDPQARAGCECGRVPFKVSDAGVNQWPWTGAIVTNGLFAGGRPHCGATLINSKYVLTAAHCIDGLLPFRTQVWLTVHDNLQNSVSSSGTLKLEVEKILMHPNYNRRTNENDIALVALVEPVSIGQSYFVPACVPAGKNEYSEFVGRMAAWGTSELGQFNNRITSNKICKMDMPILSNNVCDRDTTHRGRITKNMLCAGFLTSKNNAACVSDAGGGLIISNGGRHTLVGITSYGYTPNRAYSPTVHTRVSGDDDPMGNFPAAA